MPELTGQRVTQRSVNYARGRMFRDAVQSIPNGGVLTKVDYTLGGANGYWANEAFTETPGAFRPRRAAWEGGGDYFGPLIVVARHAFAAAVVGASMLVVLIQDGGVELEQGWAGPRNLGAGEAIECVTTSFVSGTDRLEVRVSHASAAAVDLNVSNVEEGWGLTVFAPFAPVE